MFASTLA